MMRRAKQNGHQAADVLDLEQLLLASMMALPEAADHAAVASLKAHDFIEPAHQTIYRNLIDLRVAGQTPEALPTKLALTGELPRDRRTSLLLELSKLQVSGSDAAYYAEQLRDGSRRRKLIELAEQIKQHAADNLPPGDIDALLATHLESSAPLDDDPFGFIDCEELAATPEHVPYLIDGVLAEGHPCLIAGPSKAMKTSCLVDLMVSLATGGHFLGYFPVQQPRIVALMSGESGRNIIAETARRIAIAAGTQLAALRGHIRWSFRLPQLDDEANIRWLGKYIERHGIEVLGIDPAFLCMDLEGKEASMFAAGPMLRRASEMCARHRCTLILAHHFRQSIRDNASPPQLQDAAWAGFEQWAGQWILTKRREPYASDGDHKLHLVTGGRAGHGGQYHLDIAEGLRSDPGGRRWETSITTASNAAEVEQQAKAEAKQAKSTATEDHRKNRVLELLHEHPGGQTTTFVGGALGMSGKTAGETLMLLLSEGKVETFEGTKANQTVAMFRLKAG